MTQDPTKSPAVSERDAIAACIYGNLFLRTKWLGRDVNVSWPQLPADDYHRRICLDTADSLARLAPAPEILVTQDQRERALAAGRAIVHGQGDGTYDEATGAIHLLLAALGGSQPTPEKGVREALEWYAEQAAGCRKISSAGDPARQALDRDGGKRAREAIATLAALAQPEAARVGGLREALDPWWRVWAVSFAPFDNGPGNGTSRWKESDGAGPLMPLAWPTIGDLRALAALATQPAAGSEG